MPANLLTSKFCNSVTEAGKYRDGDGLELRVSGSQGKSWVMKVRFRGKRPEIGLGSFPDITLSDARDKARKIREAVANGTDPRAALKPQGTAHKGAVTFKQAAHEFIDIKSPEWRNEKHAQQWGNTLATYAFPVIGDMPVAGIRIEHIEEILRPIWVSKTETASRVRSFSGAQDKGALIEKFWPIFWSRKSNQNHVFSFVGQIPGPRGTSR